MKIVTILKLIYIILSQPKTYIKKISLSKLKVLLHALKSEPNDKILHNSKKYFNENSLPDNIKTNIDQTSIIPYEKSKESFEDFLKTNKTIDFSSENANLAVIINFNDKAEFGFALINNIKESIKQNFKLIIIGNKIDEEFSLLIKNLKGVYVIEKNGEKNILDNIFEIVSQIKQDFLLLLNLQTLIITGHIDEFISILDKDEKLGAICPKFDLFLGNHLKSGSLIYSDHLSSANVNECKNYESRYQILLDNVLSTFLITKVNLVQEYINSSTERNTYLQNLSDYYFWLKERNLKIDSYSNIKVSFPNYYIDVPKESFPLAKSFPENYTKGLTKRIAVFASYNQNGKVLNYVLYYLKELKKVVDGIIFIADNPTSKEEAEKLDDKVCYYSFERHEEYDFGSYKRGFEYAKGNGLLQEAKELIFCNDSCIGPVFPFEKTFKSFNDRKIDFWGMTINKDFDRHIQSYFMVFKRNVFNHDSFSMFFNRIKKEEKVDHVIQNYEIKLSNYLESYGFTYGSLVPEDMNDIENKHSKRYFDLNPTTYPLTILSKYNCPLVKVKALLNEEFNCESIIDLLIFIEIKNKELNTYL
jgi:hypothetical protein